MNTSAIAVVGMAGRFPGAPNIDEFWRNLCNGIESIRQLSDSELLAAGVAPHDLAAPDYVKAAAILDNVQMFDASFFGFSPKDASIMDPQQRHFLECAWEALEYAGHTPENFPGSIGVYAGSGMNSYLIHNLLTNRGLVESAGLFMLKMTGNDKDVLSTRASYHLNLRGPSVSVQTACSTSLVAIHLACQSLLNYECDMALAGGVTIEVPHGQGYVYREGEILSRDGHCRSFDASSSGTVFSSGAGIVVLRRLEEALEDHDTIHAVILGSAVNNDGGRKVGYFAPSVEGQSEVIAEALGVAGVAAASISYVETHGTGTRVGDPIEIKGLTQAFHETMSARHTCAIGSLKSNVGHLDAAAGVAGLIKCVLALKHRRLPASLHFRNPNPLIDFENSPFYVNNKLSNWNSDPAAPRRAGVTSLGIGGTNAHVVLEEAPEVKPSTSGSDYQLVVLSAKTEAALEQATSNLASHLQTNPDLNLAEVAFTTQIGRSAFAHRRVLVARSVGDACQALAARSPQVVFSGRVASAHPSVVFMFSGQGSQYVNMGSEMYLSEPAFRGAFDTCAEALEPILGLDLRDMVFARSGDGAACSEQLSQTRYTQPALFSLEYALAQWWMKLGIQPQAMVGHSIGEYVAACLAGVFSLADALELTAVRGRLMQQMPAGAMVAVPLGAQELSVSEPLSVAAVNAPQQCVVSGPRDAIEKFESDLGRRGVSFHRLHTSHAFHSRMMDPILEPFREHVRRIELKAPRIPYLSNVTGAWITPAEATNPEYWVRHLRSTVRFSDCLTELFGRKDRTLLEVGPGQTLATLAQQHPGRNAKVYASMPHPQEKLSDAAHPRKILGQLWIGGQTVDWAALHSDETVRRIPLPTYPFERQRYWIEPGSDSLAGKPEVISKPADQDGINDWFQRRSWRRAPLRAGPAGAPTCCVVFLDPLGLGQEIVKQLRSAGNEVIVVVPGESYARLGEEKYAIQPGARADYDALLADLEERGRAPRKFVHLWSMLVEPVRASLDDALNFSFYSLLFLVQALGDQDLKKLDLLIVSDRLQSVSGESITNPVRAALFGPAKVALMEFPEIGCCAADVNLATDGIERSSAQIVAELSARSGESVVAFRDGERWAETFERVALRPNSTGSRLKDKGVYLITGGLGDVGLAIAAYLARNFQARLILLGRTPFPPPEQWKEVLESDHAPDRIKQNIRKLREMQSFGAEIFTVNADVTELGEMTRAFRLAGERFSAIDGVVHAAGVIEDSPLLVKTRESAARVLDPKVRGTLVLAEVLADRPLDFVALFSSISSWVPPAGQVDYAAANAFLDAFAISWHGAPVVAINWGRWRDLGMGVRTTALAHPLLDRRILDTPEEFIYSSQFSCARHWLLDEHRFKAGDALVPGTGYLEMALAAFGSINEGVELRDVFFQAPLAVTDDEAREVRLKMKKDDTSFRFSILADDSNGLEYATGEISRSATISPKKYDLTLLAARCDAQEIVFGNQRWTRQERYIDFGPRWRNLERIHVGNRESLAVLELPAAHKSDLENYLVHPALLDLATGAALYLIPNYDSSESLYLPVSYRRVSVFKRLPDRIYSYIRSRESNTLEDDIVTFDITILDKNGIPLIDIEQFSLRKISDLARVSQKRVPINEARPPRRVATTLADDPQTIPAEKGAEAFGRILSAASISGIAVSPGLLKEPKREILDLKPAGPAADARADAKPATSADEVETQLISVWEDLLGVKPVRVHDNFFDLGGHSLLAARLSARVRKIWGTNLPLATLFQAPTIEKLATVLRGTITTKGSPRVAAIKPEGSLPPFLCVDAGPYFRLLAKRLNPGQPFLGLRLAETEHLPVHFSMSDIAAYHIATIREIQPQGPYYLGGWSASGLVAYEIAQQLHREGQEVALLVLFDVLNSAPPKPPSTWDRSRELFSFLTWKVRFHLSRLRQLQRNEFRAELRYVFRRIRLDLSRMLWVVGDLVQRHASHRLAVAPREASKAVFIAARDYRPEPYGGRVLLFRSAVQSEGPYHDPKLGWAHLLGEDLEISEMPGDHEDMFREPYVDLLAKELDEALAVVAERMVLAPPTETSKV
jgi:acyl transferase domain-containing protein/thioesterase domain-containing protein/NAD(P)-dependent dehydrogenase (short-subunit alcohol dehydrogenase family)